MISGNSYLAFMKSFLYMLRNVDLSGSEWVNDWYASDYYSHPPVNDPQGPEKGTLKVLRGYVGGDSHCALTMFRQSSQPVPKFGGATTMKKYGVGPFYVFHCVMNN